MILNIDIMGEGPFSHSSIAILASYSLFLMGAQNGNKHIQILCLDGPPWDVNVCFINIEPN